MSSTDFYNDPAPRVRPSALTVICVFCIVFGALGLLAGLAGLVSQLASSAIQQAITAGQSGASGAAAEAQAEMVTRTMAIAAKYNPVMIPLSILKILIEGALLIGGIMAIRLKGSGRSLLASVLLAALIFEAIQFVPKYMVTRDTQAAVAELMPQIMAAQQGANQMPPGLDMSSMMSGIGTVTLALGLVWLAVKIVLYLLATRYLRRPDIVALFQSSTN